MAVRKPILEGKPGDMKEGCYVHLVTLKHGVAVFQEGTDGRYEIFLSRKKDTSTKWHLQYRLADWEFCSLYVEDFVTLSDGADVPDMRNQAIVVPYKP